MGAAEATAVAAWLTTAPGQARLHQALDRRRLPLSLADDLAQDVAVAALLAAGPLDSVEAFATAVAQRRAVDLVRARVRRPEAGLDPWVDAPLADDAPGPDVVAVDLAGAGDDARRRLAALPAVAVAVRSAGLTAVTVAVGDVPLPPDCPRPGQGAAAADGPLWAGVWFAGGHDCWPDPDTPAARKRRSRAVAAARAALATAVAPS